MTGRAIARPDSVSAKTWSVSAEEAKAPHGATVPVDALLAMMRRTAASELARHVPWCAQCVCCGQIWPCGRAQQADMALS